MRIEGTFLRSRVARRIFFLFCIAALAPTFLISILAYRTAVDSLRASGEREATATSKRLALTVYERLDVADRILGGIAERAGDAGATDPAANFARFFRDVFHVQADGNEAKGLAPRHAAVAAALRIATEADSPANRILVVDAGDGSGDPGIVLVLPRAADGPGAGGWLAAEVNPPYLWGDTDEFPAENRTCAYASGGRRLFCSSFGGGSVRDSGVTGSWNLFLAARFTAQPWTFTTSVPDRTLAEELPGLAWAFVTVWVGVLLLAMLLSLIQIRRSMVPLENLVAQTRRIAQGKYDSGALAPSDEFGLLSVAFDEMGSTVSRHVATLNALSEVDRRILARQDIADIVDVVLERMRQIVPSTAVALMYSRSASRGSAQCHLRTQVDGETRRYTVHATASQDASHDPVWLDIDPAAPDEPLAGLRGAGARYAQVCTRAGAGGVRVWAALGFAERSPPSEQCVQEISELCGRVAVALSTQERDELLVYQARHDLLTGLPNRFATQEALGAAVANSARTGEPFTVLFFDIDRFKAINDGLGHLSGDRMLVQVAEILRRSVAGTDFIARFGGDEFFAILPALRDRDVIAAAAARIANAFAAPIEIDGMEFVVSTSIGIAVHPRDGADADALLRSADIAMYRAKAAGGGRFAFFEERMNREALERIQLEAELRQALLYGAIDVHFQPKVDYRTDSIVGVEALARWAHPVRGQVPPLEFVALAEECGLIEELGAVVLERACAQFAAWRADGAGLQSVSVNVSGRQLRSDAFIETVRHTIRAHRLNPAELELEITESVLVAEVDTVTRRLQSLRELGATIAIDDFGTGYSSLAYLRTLPVDTLKIDRAFIVDVDRSESAGALVQAIIALGNATGKTMVAEGVERRAQAELLLSWSCHFIQGFLHFAPMPAAQLGAVFAARAAVHREPESARS